MSDANSDLTLSEITKEFSGVAGTLQILRGVELNLKRGNALAITGPSGSGKSTLLYIIGTLEQPTSGSVNILGDDPFTLGAAELADFRNRNIGFIFQDHHLLPQCTVLENVLIPTLAGSGAGKDEEQRARKLLERVGLGDRITHRPAQISGGERQRVAVCRALINQPALLLADEPTGNLDRSTAESVGSLLLELSKEQNTILICVTHSSELADRFPLHSELLDGKLVKTI
ncbi:MAG: ABC transporter ATP-binding protein [Planctomycetes bacterium]|nr:ABC transporter ATP-binding protein [Planctomycetota bacterium]